MSKIAKIPYTVKDRAQLPGLKIGDLVQTLKLDFSQSKNGFLVKSLPAGSVGRVKRIFDFGKQETQRFLICLKIEGHPLTDFYSQELKKVRV